MTLVNVYEAKTQLSRLVVRAEQGEDIVIARDGKPIVRLVPLTTTTAHREPGGARGQIRFGDDFDVPLPDDLAHAFER